MYKICIKNYNLTCKNFKTWKSREIISSGQKVNMALLPIAPQLFKIF